MFHALRTCLVSSPRSNSPIAVRHDRIGELRASSSPCSPEEWESILKALLLGAEPIEGIEAGAEANVGKSITITVRRRVAGINVGLTPVLHDIPQSSLPPSNALAL